jgi:prophage regulatory protein
MAPAVTFMSADPSVDRLIDAREVRRIIGVSSTTLWRWTRAGRFPGPLKIGVRKTAWRLSAVRAWIEAQTAVG